MDFIEEKTKLRKEIKNKISSITEKLPEYSDTICNLLMESEVYENCDCILAYMSLPDEVNLQKLLTHSLHRKKSIFIPKVDISTNKMSFYQFEENQSFTNGAFGIREPLENKPFIFDASFNRILVLVPGRAFSLDGSRLGRGKAFYDSFLSELKGFFRRSVTFCGVAFSLQFLEKLPQESHDIKMDMLVNEKGIFFTS